MPKSKIVVNHRQSSGGIHVVRQAGGLVTQGIGGGGAGKILKVTLQSTTSGDR